MPIGQFSGSKAKYAYTTDSGEIYVLTLDTDLVATGSGLTAAVAGTGQPAPKRFKPRGVHWQGTTGDFIGKRKFLICGTSTAALYASNSSQAVTIDGAAGKTTGRRGEVQSF